MENSKSTTSKEDMLEVMRKAHEEGEKRRLAQLAARTPEQIARDEENHRIEVETHRRRTGASLPEPVQPAPVPAGQDDVIIAEKHEVGSIIEYRGEKWLVTLCEKETEEEGTVNDEYDERLPLGWHSWLVRLAPQVMQIVSEQFGEGAAQFTSSTTVQFTDEQYAHSLFDLACSPESGLYDKTQVQS